MNWIVASTLMFCSSVAVYLSVRKSNEYKTPQQLNNLAMFLIPVVVYMGMGVAEHTPMSLSTTAAIIIIIQGIFFSYLGNVFSLLGIQLAPNPGYSLMISKSYVVFTAIASIFVFQSPLTAQSILAIACIVGFSALIMIDTSKKSARSDQKWVLYTLGAFFCWGMLALTSKHLLNIGVPILTRLVYSMAIVTTLIFLEIYKKRVSFSGLSRPQLFYLGLIGIFGASFNYFMQLGFALAPNVGFVNAANAASISLLTILSAVLFKDELTVRKVIGVAGTTLGLILLFV